MKNTTAAYQLAQASLANLKSAIYLLLSEHTEGLTNAQIGKALGIYYGHSGKQEGHISRTMLAIMEAESVVEQDAKTKIWKIKIIK